MAKRLVPAVFFCGAFALAGCAQQEETLVRAEPVFDKYGNGGCIDDGGDIVYIPGTVPEELVPCDEICEEEPIYDAAGNLIDPCLPPPQDDSSDNDGGGRGTTINPTTGAAG